MSITKTFGGDRIGSGNKMKNTMHGFGRSTFNLSKKVTTSMACGTLVPVYVNVCQDHDKWEIDIDSLVRTVPTVAPLFGSFKFQVDFFVAPMRLYQGLLHNNPTQIGMNMKQVYVPKLEILGRSNNILTSKNNFEYISPDSLLKYLGISGIGLRRRASETEEILSRKFFAMPTLAYYDIFKNYYANKQEEKAYIITGYTALPEAIDGVHLYNKNLQQEGDAIVDNDYYRFTNVTFPVYNALIFTENKAEQINVYLSAYDSTTNTWEYGYLCKLSEIKQKYNWVDWEYTSYNNTPAIGLNSSKNMGRFAIKVNNETTEISKLQDFPLENIDKMRYKLLSNNEIGSEVVISPSDELPYKALCDIREDNNASLNTYSQNGLALKTYQSDMFNNWLRTEWIDGENGITAITAIDVSDGTLTIDSINLQQKLYNLLNRIVVSGGTYEDWLEAVYGEEQARKCETPMYIGGMSSEICFEEVVSTAETNNDGQDTKLGTLAGKGTLLGKKGGKIEITITEPSIIMGIASITPRVSYWQGNKWFNTEIDTMDDFHKPELDGIGFQNLITEQMAWWDTNIVKEAGTTEIVRNSAGKVPAWLNYMTDVDEVFGDFCDNNKAGYMVLKRDYTINSEGNYASTDVLQVIEDLTTYIDPSKFNYAFAYQGLDAQNFWVQLNFNVKPRRKMSARLIPNL